MNCTPNALIREARCYQCIPPGILWATAIYTLCRWANAGGCDLPAKATNPLPASGNDHVGALGVALGTGPTLSWDAVPGATSYDVSFNGGPAVNQPGTTFTPPTLAYATAYTWRVDPINACGKTTGDDWTFTTAAKFEWTPHGNNATWTDGTGTFTDTWTNFDLITTARKRTVTDVNSPSDGITAVLGIQSLPSLQTIDFADNNISGTIDARDCPFLTSIKFGINSITGFLVSGSTNLQYIDCHSNLIPALNVTGLTALVTLYANTNQLSTSGVLNLSGLDNLQILYLGFQGGNVTVTLPDLSNMQELGLDQLGIASINLSAAQGTLTTLQVTENNLSGLNLTGFASLVTLKCSNNGAGFTALNLDGCTSLTTLWCDFCGLSSVTNFSDAVNLTEIVIQGNPFTGHTLDISWANSMIHLVINGTPSMQTLTISSASTNWFDIDASDCALTQASVDSILAAVNLNSQGNAGGIDLNTPLTNASPTGGVLNPDYVALTGAGWAVAIN